MSYRVCYSDVSLVPRPLLTSSERSFPVHPKATSTTWLFAYFSLAVRWEGQHLKNLDLTLTKAPKMLANFRKRWKDFGKILGRFWEFWEILGNWKHFGNILDFLLQSFCLRQVFDLSHVIIKRSRNYSLRCREVSYVNWNVFKIKIKNIKLKGVLSRPEKLNFNLHLSGFGFIVLCISCQD
jgi:hypothetical protein